MIIILIQVSTARNDNDDGGGDDTWWKFGNTWSLRMREEVVWYRSEIHK